MARFVSFPGTAGSYASTDDVNLLDADTAHMQQSIGRWTAESGALTPEQSQAMTPIFGTSHASAEAFSTVPRVNSGSPGNYTPATPGTTYSTSAYMAKGAGATAGLSARLRMVFWDAGEGLISRILGSQTLIPDALVWQHITQTEVAPALTAFISFEVEFRDAAGGDFMYWDAAIIREGSDTTFIPSLRIVGDLDIRARVAPQSWMPAVNNVLGARRPNNVDNKSFRWQLRTDGLIRYSMSIDGLTENNFNSNDPISLPDDGVPHDIRTEFVADNGAAGRTATFYVDDVQIGSPHTIGPAGGSFTGDSPFEIGTYNLGTIEPFLGDIYSSTLRDGIDGPIVAVFDPDDIAI